MGESMRAWVRRSLLLGSFGFVGCAAPVAGDLGEREANRAIVALEARGVIATKQADPAHEGRWQLTVPRHEAPEAVAALQAEGLPHPEAPGVLATLGDGSLVPSRANEQARWIAGTSGDLERTLLGIDGMLAARVHLAVPARHDLTLDAAPVQPSASVLLRHRGATPPLGLNDVQRLVAGAVPGLAPERVAVVTAPVPDVPRSGAPNLVRLGPVAVARSSLGPLRFIAGGAVGANLALLAAAIAIWVRLRRTQIALETARAQLGAEAER